MECVSIPADYLVTHARAAGLVVLADHGRLVVRGPREAEPIAKELLASKPAVMATLAIEGEWESWTELRDGVTWHIIQRSGEQVFPWCDRPPVPMGIHAARPTS